MMTILAQLCALCAVCTLCEIAMPDEKGQESLRLIGGILMLHLVLSQSRDLIAALMREKELMRIFEVLLK